MSYKQILTTNDIGTGENQIAAGNHNHTYLVPKDERSILTKPSDYGVKLKFSGLKTNTTISNPSNDNFSYVVGLRGWFDDSGGFAHELAFNDTGLFHRRGSSNDTWLSWDKILTKSNGDDNYVKKSGDTMTGMLQFSGISTADFTEGIRINKAADGWTNICLGGSASSGCSTETWSIHTQQDGASANFWLTHNGSNGSTDSTGCLGGANNGVWTLSNLLQIVNPNTNINEGSSQVAVIKGDNTTSSLTLYYNRDGNRGLWDNSTQKSLIYLDPNNNAISNFRWHFTGQDNSLHNLNGNYQANLSNRPFASALEIRENGFVGNSQSDIGYAPSIGFHWGGYCAGTLCLRNDAVLQWYNQTGLGTFQAGAVWGAVWNDYAEFRKAESIEPGRCVIEHSSAEMKLSTERLQPGAEIISDTFGFAIGETDECKTPIASSGRVLAYPYEDRNSYPLGAAVCSGPNGTISLMTREEIKEYPERIIGTVSEIPNYEEWGTGKVKVNGRIWIRIR